jgi:lipoprotein-releasing system permease protein
LNLSLLFARRYFKSKKSTNAINIIAWISILAIVIGTSALITVLSVFNGFEGLVKSLYSSFYTDLKVLPATGKTITLTPQQLQEIKSTPGVKNFSAVIEEKALLKNNDGDKDYQNVVVLKGVDDNYQYVSGVAQHIVAGNYDIGTLDTPRIVLGAGVEGSLNVQSDRNIFPLTVYLPRKGNTEQIDVVNDISSNYINTSSTFLIQQDFDNKYAITNIDFMRDALKYKTDEYSGLEITLNDIDKTDDVKRSLINLLGDNYKVLDKYEQNKSLYSVMNLERWAIYGVLSLVLIVAAFTMIGALTMLALEKQKDVAVLHAMGANRSFIQKIFLKEGVLLAFIGGVAGMLLALAIIYAQINFKLIKLEGGSFLINYFPVKLRLMDFTLVGITVFIIALIASWFPARKAASQEFSLRSE